VSACGCVHVRVYSPLIRDVLS